MCFMCMCYVVSLFRLPISMQSIAWKIDLQNYLFCIELDIHVKPHSLIPTDGFTGGWWFDLLGYSKSRHCTKQRVCPDCQLKETRANVLLICSGKRRQQRLSQMLVFCTQHNKNTVHWCPKPTSPIFQQSYLKLLNASSYGSDRAQPNALIRLVWSSFDSVWSHKAGHLHRFRFNRTINHPPPALLPRSTTARTRLSSFRSTLDEIDRSSRSSAYCKMPLSSPGNPPDTGHAGSIRAPILRFNSL